MQDVPEQPDSLSLAELSEAALSSGGALDRGTAGFVERSGQIAFARAAAEAIENRSVLVAEAGTGTGKTFAYLTPALLSGTCVIVSTAGKALQDQLFRKDIPALQKALGREADAAVLKGRANYVCLHRLEKTRDEGRLPARDSYVKLRKIMQFAAVSPTGDRADLPDVPENDPLWPYVTSSRENCLGPSKCAFAKQCFVARARERAMQAQVVVVNHHLYLSALALRHKETGDYFDGILPKAGLTVIDEAHQLASIATNFFGEEVSTQKIQDIASEARRLGRVYVRDGAAWEVLYDKVIKTTQDVSLAVRALGLEEGAKKAVRSIRGFGKLVKPLEEAARAFRELGAAMKANEGRNDDLDALRVHHAEVALIFDSWVQVAEMARSGAAPKTFLQRALELEASRKEAGSQEEKPGPAEAPSEKKASRSARKKAKKAEEKEAEETRARAALSMALTELGVSEGAPSVAWIEVTAYGVRFHRTPLSFAREFALMREEEDCAWIFTSATLSTGGSFKHFQDEIGLEGEDVACRSWPSPFNFWEQGCFYLPELPPPANNVEVHTANVVEAAWPLVVACEGRAFFLCTSLAAVRRAEGILREKLEANHLPYPLLVQGEQPRGALIDAFRRSGNAVLVGSMGFWEGIDVKGEALSLVVIDKLPFAPPDDPVTEARCDEIRRQGGNPFMTYTLPEAVIALKQGAGRLIRSESDRGLFMLGDSRLVQKAYGRLVIESLPDFHRTRRLDKALRFFSDPKAWAEGLYR